MTQPSKPGDAGFAVEAGPELPVRRIGVLGCGRIGRMHAGLLAREVSGYVVAAVADAVPAAAAGVSDAIGAPVRSIKELLASDDVDTVAICTSTDTHVDLVIAAAEAGKAIFCEKPVSLDLAPPSTRPACPS
jgi:myo-inositol 2-dehydrogenase/D-chiro-inositol 1-dehydrogenase